MTSHHYAKCRWRAGSDFLNSNSLTQTQNAYFFGYSNQSNYETKRCFYCIANIVVHKSGKILTEKWLVNLNLWPGG